MLDKEEVKNLWNQAADWWARHLREDPNRKEQVLPTLVELLEGLEGKNVLDAGCGEGTVARLLSDAGAQVTGIDLSRIINFAIEEEERAPKDIKYYQMDISEAPQHFPGGSFDIIVCSLVLHSCPDLENVLKSLRYLARNGGYFVVCDLHPTFVTPYSPWFHSWKSTYAQPNGSFVVKIAENAPGVPCFYRPLETLIGAFPASGFHPNKILEPDAPLSMGQPPGESLFLFVRCLAQ
ncbi:class I SAM-dependent methyltransferase [Acidobacteria bacterium AH-259-G07]|nr:class I SAM-dependent methyltransferase [Acidobacteria bacterium AH-259-G07]